MTAATGSREAPWPGCTRHHECPTLGGSDELEGCEGCPGIPTSTPTATALALLARADADEQLEPPEPGWCATCEHDHLIGEHRCPGPIRIDGRLVCWTEPVRRP